MQKGEKDIDLGLHEFGLAHLDIQLIHKRHGHAATKSCDY